MITAEIHNYYGQVYAEEKDGKYYLCLEDWDDINKREISKEFYKAFEKEFKKEIEL